VRRSPEGWRGLVEGLARAGVRGWRAASWRAGARRLVEGWRADWRRAGAWRGTLTRPAVRCGCLTRAGVFRWGGWVPRLTIPICRAMLRSVWLRVPGSCRLVVFRRAWRSTILICRAAAWLRASGSRRSAVFRRAGRPTILICRAAAWLRASGSRRLVVFRRAGRPTILICRAVFGPLAGRCCAGELTWTFAACLGAVNVHASRNGSSGAR